MDKTLSRRLVTAISFLMVALVFCQGMAQAAMVGTALPAAPMAGMTCHETGMAGMKGMPAKAGCAADCQHLDKATDSVGQLPSALDHTPILIGFLLAPVDAPISLRLAATWPPDPASDPPLPIRFQRFRE